MEYQEHRTHGEDPQVQLSDQSDSFSGQYSARPFHGYVYPDLQTEVDSSSDKSGQHGASLESLIKQEGTLPLSAVKTETLIEEARSSTGTSLATFNPYSEVLLMSRSDMVHAREPAPYFGHSTPNLGALIRRKTSLQAVTEVCDALHEVIKGIKQECDLFSHTSQKIRSFHPKRGSVDWDTYSAEPFRLTKACNLVSQRLTKIKSAVTPRALSSPEKYVRERQILLQEFNKVRNLCTKILSFYTFFLSEMPDLNALSGEELMNAICLLQYLNDSNSTLQNIVLEMDANISKLVSLKVHPRVSVDPERLDRLEDGDISDSNPQKSSLPVPEPSRCGEKLRAFLLFIVAISVIGGILTNLLLKMIR